MSMISEQIKELQDLSAKLRDMAWNGKHYDKIVDSAIDTIKELSTKVANGNIVRSSKYYHDGWVPCDERLPDIQAEQITAGTFLVTVKLINESGVHYYIRLDDFILTDTGARDWRTYPTTEKRQVVAWMDLPEPYSEGEK